MRYKKTVMVAVGCLALLALGAFLLLGIGFASDDGTESFLDDEEIQVLRNELECDRLTKEFRETDKYCDNAEQYYEDLDAGLIEPVL